LRSNVELYGGFTGTETTLAEADPVANPTIVDGANEAGDSNVNNVFVGQYVEKVLLDGLTVRGGRSTVDPYVSSNHDLFGGGGVAFSDGSIEVRDCTFEDNQGQMGGAISSYTATVAISNSTFTNNRADERGGGVYGYDVTMISLEDSLFSGNHAMNPGEVGGGGGGVFVESEGDGEVHIADCVFNDNHAIEVLGEANEALLMAGALGAMGVTLTVDRCTFDGNTANLDGGAVKTVVTVLEIRDSSFSNNETVNADLGSGAGLSLLEGTALIERCTFDSNFIEEPDEPASVGRGGGIEVYRVVDTQIVDCVFTGNNVPGDGGAVTVLNSPMVPEEGGVSFERCVFLNNSSNQGGGIFIASEGEGVVGDISVVHSTFASNTAANGGADIYFIDSPDVGSLDISSSILWSGTEPLAWEEVDSPPVVTYSDVCSGCTGEGNIDADPLFVDEGNGDLHLSEGSPCIGTGEEGSDMGAYPYEG
jgi:hypothetical protein